ncbi:type II/IV secretion system ATPase subunit [Candidatus Pacearchaeota archaeon]|nr:type II/IV secretion system ATPase subunit [Candidatus Pacearchaeota archaeon]
MLFKPGTPLYAYEVEKEADEDVMYINFLGAPLVPNIADSQEIMAQVIDYLIKTPNVSRIVFVQQRNYSYDYSQLVFLREIANLYTRLVNEERVLSPNKLSYNNPNELAVRYNFITYLLGLLKSDPLACFFELKNAVAKEKSLLASLGSNKNTEYDNLLYLRLLENFIQFLLNLRFFGAIEKYLEDYKFGDRKIYSYIFRPDIIPNFTFTRLVSQLPREAKIVDQYQVGEGYDISVVTILKKSEEVKYFYHLMPPEYSLKEDHHLLLNLARNVLIEHQPKAEEFTDPERTRQVFFNVSRDLVRELADNQGIKLSYSDINKLAMILVRHTIGFGLIEVLLKDKNLQDIVLNAPITQNPIFLRHNDFDECSTNIIPSQEDADSWAAKFRMISGRPLDEANPILDTDLSIGEIRARIAVVQQPLSPSGIAYAVRRHRESPWTLPLFIKNKMINSFGAGLMSFLVDGSRTMLVAGTRSSGKTSLLGSLMLEIMPKYRIITIEDTPELAVDTMRKLNYDILRMKVRSALLQTTNEVSADEGIRTSLRLGDSCLIIGEVRSQEARALYEAMRIGALANVVAGTIHGASPYGVFDRVVNDLGVPVTSFKATDCIIVANPVKTPDGMHSVRRVLQLTEVRKHWTRDPLEEKGFVDLLKYNVEKDELEPSEDLINGDSEIIKNIAAGVKSWAGNWDAVYDNILLRAKIKAEIVNLSEKIGKPEILEAGFNVLSNSIFHQVSDKITEEIGLPLGEKVFPEWQKWAINAAKKI